MRGRELWADNAQEVNFNSNGTSPKNFRALKLQRLSILYGIYFSNHMINTYIFVCGVALLFYR